MAEALDGGALFTLEGHVDRVSSVCFSPDEKQLASGSRDRTMRLWDVETGASLCPGTLNPPSYARHPTDAITGAPPGSSQIRVQRSPQPA